MNHEALRKLGKAALRLAELLGYTPHNEATDGPTTDSVQERATVKEDAPKVRVPLITPKVDDGAPTPKLKEPRWILTVAQGPRRLYMVLYQIARGVVRSRGYARRTAQITLHLPVDLLAEHLGVNRSTVWRWAKELESKGLIHHRTHYGTLEGRTVATGTVWAIRLRPGKARLTYEDLRHPWRNLEEDRRSGATAWAWKGKRPDLRVLVLWALGARTGPRRPAPEGAGPPVDLYRLYDLPTAPKGELPSLITHLAAHIASLMNDPGGRRYYAGILWKVAQGELRPQAVVDAIRRTRADMAEGWARRPGALLNRRLEA